MSAHFSVDHETGVAVIVLTGPEIVTMRRAVNRSLNTDEKQIGSWLYELSDALNPQSVPAVQQRPEP